VSLARVGPEGGQIRKERLLALDVERCRGGRSGGGVCINLAGETRGGGGEGGRTETGLFNRNEEILSGSFFVMFFRVIFPLFFPKRQRDDSGVERGGKKKGGEMIGRDGLGTHGVKKGAWPKQFGPVLVLSLTFRSREGGWAHPAPPLIFGG
jgi:hypothetical protein